MSREDDATLRWPRQLFREEASQLVNNMALSDWRERCELLLEDAFAGTTPRDEFGRVDERGQRGYLVTLLRHADTFCEEKPRTPYWSQRRRGPSLAQTLNFEGVVREFVKVVKDLEARGYLEAEFEKDCVDAPTEVVPSEVIEDAVGHKMAWPLDAGKLAEGPEAHNRFFDLVELLHDLAERPRKRWLHQYAGCGWHYGEFSPSVGRAVYRWRVNQVLDRSDLRLRLADEGEDSGRLVAVTDEGRADLLAEMTSRPDESTGERVRHSIALFRQRGATEHDKRSAVVVLAGVLEERRSLLKQHLSRKDEGALFEIANKFAIRHADAVQLGDYDGAFLDWFFWWYLSTVELTDRLLVEQAK